ncbi:MAG TPA: WYL domain-containing protein [Allosphingosinicella sp.]|nr:WYL domain-containing protein [Allosphingosinicella sp.]
MRASRLLSILILLQLRVRLTAEALAEEFEVSVRTIYRDIDALSAAGIPVYGDRGPGGGFQLLDGYRTRLTGLAAGEAEALMMIGLPGPAAALGLGGAAARVRGKLLAALPAAGSAEAGRTAARFHVDPVDWYRADEPVRHLPAIARAVLDQRVVTMTYESWKGIRDWRIEPLGLVLKGGSWYLAARGAEKVRIFKVSNILDQAVGEEGFERPADFDLPRWWAAELKRFEADLRPGIAVLRGSPECLRRLAELGAYAAEAALGAKAADSEGWRQLDLPIETIEQAALLVLGIGPEVEVIAPPELRACLRRLAEEVVARAG